MAVTCPNCGHKIAPKARKAKRSTNVVAFQRIKFSIAGSLQGRDRDDRTQRAYREAMQRDEDRSVYSPSAIRQFEQNAKVGRFA